MTKGQPIDTHIQLDHDPELNKYFKAAIKTKASDLHLKVGQPSKLRIHGDLKNTTGEIMTAEKIEQLVFELFSPAQKDFFLEHGTIDFAYEVGGDDRFRINVFRQRGFISLAARRVNSKVPPFEDLHLPQTVLEKISDGAQGLVLVVGPTGCGKSTTIAAMIEYINRTRPCHIITIEDPIEYIFKDAKAIISQREIGIDIKDYEDALRYMMREDPDVVMIGEMRDSETIKAGMRAAETGHLVFGTLHASNASQAIQRMLDLFPQSERDLVRQTLSIALKAIVSQVLLPSTKEGVDRIPAVEILLASPSVKKLISEGREGDLPSVIKASEKEGMLDFTTSMCSLIQSGMVDAQDAYQHTPNVEELKMALKGIRTSTSGIL